LNFLALQASLDGESYQHLKQAQQD
jgi:hypothetical protein